MTYGYKEARKLVQRELDMQHRLANEFADQVLNVPLLMGPVGVGKTAIAKEMAEHYGLPLAAINLGENSDVTDVSGIPVPTETSKGARYSEWVLNRYASNACDEPTLLFFDDLDKAPSPIQGSLLGVFGDRMFRDRPLHKGTLVMGAGNRIEDDMYANEISESIRTRATIIELIPNVMDFAKYGKSTGEIHPVILGYLMFKPQHLYKAQEGVNRFPTARGWKEASRQFFAYPDPREDVLGNRNNDNWKGIVARKVGDHIANDFWGWFDIVSRINVANVLKTGNLPDADNSSVERITQYATVFAVSKELNKAVKKEYTGIPKLTRTLSPEMRIAFIVQLSKEARAQIAKYFEEAAEIMMSHIISSGSDSYLGQP